MMILQTLPTRNSFRFITCGKSRRNCHYFATTGALYKSMLEGYKKSMKKPSPLSQEVEIDFWESFLRPNASLSSLKSSIDYIVRLRSCKFFSVAALDKVDSYLSEVSPKLPREYQVLGACFLAEQARPQPPVWKDSNSPNELTLVLEMYCSFLYNNAIEIDKRWNNRFLDQMVDSRKY